jgi:valyl-tRNA synthetase
VRDAGDQTRRRIAAHRELLSRLARLSSVQLAEPQGPEAKGAAQIVIDEATLLLPLAGVIDIGQEKARLSRERAKLQSEVEKLEKKLGNAQFVAKAPAEVVEEQRARLADAQQAEAKLAQALDRLAL